MIRASNTFWSVPARELLDELQTSLEGLTADLARERLARYGANLLKPKRRANTLSLLLAQFISPLVLLLLFAAGLSLFLHDSIDALIILIIVVISGLLGFWQERSASQAVAKLLAIVQIKATVLRDGIRQDIPLEEVVPGDLVLLRAGDVIPADCVIVESRDLFVQEATLTGESYPVEKMAGALLPDTPLARRANTLFLGTHVTSGTATAVVVRTGSKTEFGKVSERLRLISCWK